MTSDICSPDMIDVKVLPSILLMLVFFFYCFNEASKVS